MSVDEPIAAVSFFVPGVPAPKGSTRSFRSAKTGRVVTLPASEKSAPWQARVAMFAKQHWSGPPTCGPIYLQVEFSFLPPKDKSAARLGPITRRTKDIDKLLRAVMDGLTGAVYQDDSQVTNVRITKSYDLESGARISVSII